MKLFRWQSHKELDEFAFGLAKEFAEKFPPTPSKSADAKKLEKRLVRTVDGIYAKAAQYHEDRKLGLYRKARLGNKFMWALREQGYDEEFIDELTNGLLRRMGGVG